MEIGAGEGALTEHLLARAKQLVAIEADRALFDRLSLKFEGRANLTLIHADVLRSDLAQWGAAVVAGNLPYYITSPILRKVLALGGTLKRAVFLVQKEVAERLTAVPGSRRYGFLTVQAQLFAEPELLFSVPPSAFSPPPKVESAVVRLQPRGVAENLQSVDPGRFLEFAGRCFLQKRKTIRNNLVGLYRKDVLAEINETSRRAEQLSVDELAGLYRRLSLY